MVIKVLICSWSFPTTLKISFARVTLTFSKFTSKFLEFRNKGLHNQDVPGGEVYDWFRWHMHYLQNK